MLRKLTIAQCMLLVMMLMASCTARPASPIHSLISQIRLPCIASRTAGNWRCGRMHPVEPQGSASFRMAASAMSGPISAASANPVSSPHSLYPRRQPPPPGQQRTIQVDRSFFTPTPGMVTIRFTCWRSAAHPRSSSPGTSSNTFSGPFSPDGTRLLFTGFGLTHSFVGVMNPDGSGQMDLSNQPESDEAFPAWSPDGKRIAFTSRRDGNNEIYIMNADGSGQTRLTNSPTDDFAPAWSPDGSQIVFVSDRDRQTGIYSLYLMSIDGSNVVRLTDDESSDVAPDWSPDGRKIVYQSIHDGQADIYVDQHGWIGHDEPDPQPGG